MKIKKMLLFLAFALLSMFKAGAVLATEVDNVTLEAVNFGGNNRYEVYHDTTRQSYVTHWERNRNTQAPLCYLRNTRVEVLAGFSVTPTNAAKDIKIRGDAGNYIFGEKQVHAADGKVRYPATASSNVLPNTIRPGDYFNIQWQWSKDGGTTWNNAGASSNQMYVVLANPGFNLLHTLVDVSCSPNAGGTYSDAIVSNIWSKFSDRHVDRVDIPRQLGYWVNGVGNAQNAADLISSGNGECRSWVSFLRDCLTLQGITSTSVTLTPGYSSDLDTRFLIKNWTFDVGTAPAVAAPFTHKTGEYHDVSGVGAQGNANPPGWFYNHVIVKRNGIYYDPSYGGSPYSSATGITAQSAWENNSLDGFDINVLIKDDFGNEVPTRIGKKNDPNQLETSFSS